MKEIKKVDPSVRKGIVNPEERLRKFPLPPSTGRFDRDVWVANCPSSRKVLSCVSDFQRWFQV